MRILVIGGTGFLGRHVVEVALGRGHSLTLLTRGRTNPELFPEAEHLHADRTTNDFAALASRTFDAVIDTCGYFPQHVSRAAEVLRDSAGHYTFVSSLAVYPDPVPPSTDETGLVATLDGPMPEKINDANEYGALKALCEEVARRAMPGRVFTVRPGLLVGPYDETGRFAYWPRRIDAGGRLIAAEPAQPVQLIDARDLASWLIDSVERGRTGTYNATGPAQPLTMEGLLEACREVSGSSTEIAWAGDGFLREQGVEPWEELPLWLPAHLTGFLEVDCSKAIEEGLRFRPLRQSIEDVLGWEASRPPQNRRWRLSPAREQELLELLA